MKVLRIALGALSSAAPVLAQTGEIVPNENLLADGIPRILAAIAEAVRPYTEVRSSSSRFRTFQFYVTIAFVQENLLK